MLSTSQFLKQFRIIAILFILIGLSCNTEKTTDENTNNNSNLNSADLVEYQQELEKFEFDFRLVNLVNGEDPEDLQDPSLETVEDNSKVDFTPGESDDSVFSENTDNPDNDSQRTSFALTSVPDAQPYLEFHMSDYGVEWDKTHPVISLTRSQLANQEIIFSETGEVFWKQTGQRLSGEYIFVMDGDGKIYAGVQDIGRFHHSSFLSGEPISAAGHLYIDENGRLKGFNNATGHYRLPGAANDQFINELSRRKVSIQNLLVGEIKNNKIEYSPKAVRSGVYSPPLDIDSLNEERTLRQRTLSPDGWQGEVVEKTRDGVKHTTYPDGSTKSDHPSGYSESEFVDGSKTRTLPDGTFINIAPSGAIKTKFPNGMIETRWPNGFIQTEAPKTLGKKSIRYPDGTIETRYASGLKVTDFKNKTRVIQFPKGSKKIIYPNGYTEIIDTDGIAVSRDANGVESRRYPNSIVEIRYPSGLKEITLQDSTKIRRYENVVYGTKELGPTDSEKAFINIDNVERLNYEVFITDDGRFVNFLGDNIDTGNGNFFAMDKDGRIFIGAPPIKSSWLLAGSPSAASGQIQVKDGKLIQLNNNSPDYRDPTSNQKFIRELQARGLNPTRVQIGVVQDFGKNPVKVRNKTQFVGAGYTIKGKKDSNWQGKKFNPAVSFDPKSSLPKVEFKPSEAKVKNSGMKNIFKSTGGCRTKSRFAILTCVFN